MSKFPSELHGLLHVGERRRQAHARQLTWGASQSAPRSALLNSHLVLGEDLEDLLHAGVLDDLLRKTLQKLSWEKTLENNRPPSKNPLWGLLAAPWTRRMFVASSLCTVVPAGAWVAHSKEATLHRQSPRATTPEGVSAYHRTCHAALADTWLTPSFTSQPPKRSD